MIQSIIVCSIYLAILITVTKYFGIKYTDIAKNTNNILKGIVYPVGICTAILTIFALYSGWLPSVLSYSPRINIWILWIIPIVLVIGILARLSYIQSSHLSKKGILMLLIGTALVGFSEELLVRGIVVSLLQKSGLSVLLVGLVSSLMFGILHFSNILLGQSIRNTFSQVVFTSLMGLNFFVIYIISGTLWLPIVLHALYDFSLLLTRPSRKDSNTLRSSVNLATIVLMNLTPVLAIVLLIWSS